MTHTVGMPQSLSLTRKTLLIGVLLSIVSLTGQRQLVFNSCKRFLPFVHMEINTAIEAVINCQA